jgi:hypothetical protein
MYFKTRRPGTTPHSRRISTISTQQPATIKLRVKQHHFCAKNQKQRAAAKNIRST